MLWNRHGRREEILSSKSSSDKYKKKRKNRKKEISFFLLLSLIGNIVVLITYHDYLWTNISTINTKFNWTELKVNLTTLIFGHDEAINIMIDEMSKYLNNDDIDVTLPLIISVHGSSGTGKTKLTDHLIDFLPNGCVHKFIIPLHFHGRYKQHILYEELFYAPNFCSFILNIFDEMDFASDLFINTLERNLRLFSVKSGLKTIILFTSVQGSDEIIDYVVSEAKIRKNIKQKEISEVIRNSWRTRLDSWTEFLEFYSDVIVLIAFLPLDRQNVRMCIKSQLREIGNASPEKIEFILKNINFFANSSDLIAVNGCKKIDSFVKLFL